MDTEQLRRQGKIVLEEMAKYYDNIEGIPLMATAKPGHLYSLIPHTIPDEPESLEMIQRSLKEKIMPGIAHWQSPNFYGWIPLNNSVPSIISEMYTATLNIAPVSWIASPAATELETIVMDAVGNDSILALMLAARDKIIARLTGNIDLDLKEAAADSVRNKLVAYCSDQTHCSAEKTARIIGCKTHTVPTAEGDFRLTKENLALAVKQYIAKGLIPFFVGSSFGTTNTATVDDLQGVADVCEQRQIWMHVDGAYGGAALACPEFRPLAAGLERADSFVFNPYKWMLTSIQCSCMWVADSRDLTRALSIERGYLPDMRGCSEDVKEYRHWRIQLSQPFRALKLWFVLRMHGAVGIRQHIRQKVELAQWLGHQLEQDGRFELVAPVVLSIVAFRIRSTAMLAVTTASGYTSDDATRDLAARINEDGRAFLLPTLLAGRPAIRVPIGATMCSQKHISMLLSIIQQLTGNIIVSK
ncbi:hypothetical protein EV174_003121 [Coemansia sp. RSA 2320]|nr:hypothetical protein EV174_003121 [Coemansia sp. RSA 2320]